MDDGRWTMGAGLIVHRPSSIVYSVPVYLLQHLGRVRLVRDTAGSAVRKRFGSVLRVIPGHVAQAGVSWVRATGVEGPQAAAKVPDEPQIGAAVAGRVHRFIVPLQQALGVGEGA